MNPEDSYLKFTKPKNLTKRQIERRLKTPITDIRESKSLELKEIREKSVADEKRDRNIMRFGTKSRMIRYEDRVVIEIFNDDLANIDAYELDKVMSISKSPLLHLSDMSDANKMYQIIPAKRRMLHFGLYMNNIGHYSGGRYYLIWFAHLLAQMGHKVTVITDKEPFFLKDFRFVDVGNRLEFISEERQTKTRWFLNAPENYFDFIIESPLVKAGFAYARKWRVPLLAVLFESPNYVREYRYGNDATDEYWGAYKNGIIRDATYVVCISDYAMSKAQDWLSDHYKGEFRKVAPCINTYVADRVTDTEERNEIVFVGRHVEFKNPNDIIFAISKISEELRPEINFVGSHSAKLREKMVQAARTVDVKIRFYANINDEEKFHLIKRSKLMVFPSVFEGFGMGPAESLYCGKPVVAYDIPVLRGEYGDTINYVKLGDVNELASEVTRLLKKPQLRKQLGEYGKNKFFEGKPPCAPYIMKKAIRKLIYGKKDLKITAGVIVLNAADTIYLALQSIYDSAEKIIVVEGAVERYAAANPDMVDNCHSVDDTIEIVKNFPDPFKKIELITAKRLWKNKNEMQNEIAKRVETDLYLKVDADEIYTESDVEYMKRNFVLDESIWIMYILKYEFWKNLETIAIGGIWDRPQARMWRWRQDFHHNIDIPTGFNFFVDGNNKRVEAPSYKSLKMMEKLCYHLGYVGNTDRINAKINYYATRGIEKNVANVFENWEDGKPTNSTNPDGTTAVKFNGELPLLMKDWFNDKIHISDVKESLENNMNMMQSLPRN